MRIILSVNYISRLNTGISNVLKIMSNSYASLNHKVYIIAMNDDFTDIDKNDFLSSHLSIVKSKNYITIFYKYFIYYKKSKADIAHIHSFWSISTIAVYIWAIIYKKRYIISTNGMINNWSLNQSKIKKKIFLFLIFENILKNADKIVVNSSFEKNYIIHKFNIKNIVIIPNGVKIINSFNFHLNNTQNKKIILFLSRIHPKKGIELLLKAWEELSHITKSNNFVLHIVGFTLLKSNHYEKKILQYIESNKNLSNVYSFTGMFGQDMWNEYQKCSAFILPTYSEGNAMVVLNAWAMKKMSITTLYSNLEYGLNENCNILIKPDIESIKSGLLFFMNLNNESVIKNGEIGYNIVNEYYNWDNIINKYLTIYN